MSRDLQQQGGGYLSTASAPVSRQHSLDTQQHADTMDVNEPSPPSSGRTAFEASPGISPAAAAPAPAAGVGVRAARLGSASAPASPGEIEGGEAAMDGFPLHQDDSALGSASAAALHPDPAVQAGLLHPTDSEAIMPVPESLTRANTTDTAGTTAATTADGVRRRDHHRHHHGHHTGSGRNTPAAAAAFYTPDYYGFQQRPFNHQNSRHATPLFSLARPLPTKEQRDAQKAYREHIRNRAGAGLGPGAKHQHPANASAVDLSHPAHHHHHNSHSAKHSRAPTPLLGPGAHHAPSAFYGAGPAMYPYGAQPMHRQDTADRNEIKDMLRQLLADQQNGKGNGTTKSGKEGKNKDIMEDSALARKEGFGDEKGKPSAAPRRGSASSGSSGTSSTTSNSDDDEEAFPNPWARFRHAMREPFAEFLGTFLLILFGTGVSLQYFLSLDADVAPNPRGTYLSVSFGWGVGVAMGVWVAGGISGGHINPAVTISLAVFRGFPWKKVPGYILAQIIGSTAAAGTTYGLYRGAINIFEGGGNVRTVSGPTATAALFSTYPLEYMSDVACFFNEFVDSAVLLMVVLAISDSNNAAPPDGLNPLVLFILILGIGACLGMQTAYCINPARDLGPRLVTWMAGYTTEVWNFRNQYWLWTPVLATISGALFGSFLYDALIYTGSESPLNRKWEFPWSSKRRAEFGPQSKEKAPAGLGPNGMEEEQYA